MAPIKIWNRPDSYRSPVAVVNRAKVGKLTRDNIPLSTTHVSQYSCPSTCQFLNAGCYAEWQGMQPFTTKRLNSNETTNRSTLAKLEARAIRAELDGKADLRVHVVGDCATPKAASLVGSAMVHHTTRYGKRAWTYTHAYRTVKALAWQGAQVVASVHNTKDFHKARSQGYKTFALATTEAHPTHKVYTDKHTGLKVLPCPAQFKHANGRKVACVDCSICQDPNVTRKAGADCVGFQPDGLKKVVAGGGGVTKAVRNDT